LHRNTSSRAIDSDVPPVYRRAPAGSKLDPFKDEIRWLLRTIPRRPGSGLGVDRAAGVRWWQDDRR
jgi:hypothetical protein